MIAGLDTHRHQAAGGFIAFRLELRITQARVAFARDQTVVVGETERLRAMRSSGSFEKGVKIRCFRAAVCHLLSGHKILLIFVQFLI
jgi:hypothetical protein